MNDGWRKKAGVGVEGVWRFNAQRSHAGPTTPGVRRDELPLNVIAESSASRG